MQIALNLKNHGNYVCNKIPILIKYNFIFKIYFSAYYVNSKGENTSLITLSLPKGQECDGGENYSINYVLECDSRFENLKVINEDEFDADSCSNTIRMKSKYGKIIQ